MNLRMLTDMLRSCQHNGGLAARLSFTAGEPGQSLQTLCSRLDPLIFPQPEEGQQRRDDWLARSRAHFLDDQASDGDTKTCPPSAHSRQPLVTGPQSPVDAQALAVLGWYAAATERALLIIEPDQRTQDNLGWRGARLGPDQHWQTGAGSHWLQEQGREAGMALVFHDNAWLALACPAQVSLLPALRALRPLCGQPAEGKVRSLAFKATGAGLYAIDWSADGPWLSPVTAGTGQTQSGQAFLDSPQALDLLARVMPSPMQRPCSLPLHQDEASSSTDSTPFHTPDTVTPLAKHQTSDSPAGDQPPPESPVDRHDQFLASLKEQARTLSGDCPAERRRTYAFFRGDRQAQLDQAEQQALRWLASPDEFGGQAPELVFLLREVRRGLCDPDAGITQAQLCNSIERLYSSWHDYLNRNAERLGASRSQPAQAGLLSAMERWLQMLEQHPFVILHRSDQQLWTDILSTFSALKAACPEPHQPHRSDTQSAQSSAPQDGSALIPASTQCPAFLQDLETALQDCDKAPALALLQALEPFRVTVQGALTLMKSQAFFLAPEDYPPLFHRLHDCLAPCRNALVAAEQTLYPVLGLANRLMHTLCDSGPGADMDDYAIARARRHMASLPAALQVRLAGEVAGERFLEDLTARLAASGQLPSLTGAPLSETVSALLPAPEHWQQQLAQTRACGDLVTLGSLTPDLSQVSFRVHNRRMTLVCPQGALPVRLSPFMSCFLETDEASPCTFTEGSSGFRLLHRAANLHDARRMLQPAAVPALPAPLAGAGTPGLLQPWRSDAAAHSLPTTTPARPPLTL